MQFREMRGEDRLRLGKENKDFVLWFSARLALLCRCTAKIGCGSEKKTKTSSFVLLFARLALSLQIVCGHWPIWLSPITVL